MEFNHIPSISCHHSAKTVGVFNASLSNMEAHFEYEVILVDDGNAIANVAGKTYTLKRGSLILISKMEPHSFEIGAHYSRYILSISSDQILSQRIDPILCSILIQRPVDFHHVIEIADEDLPYFFGIFESLENEYKSKNPYYESKITALLYVLLIDLYRKYPIFFPETSVQKMQEIIAEIQFYIMKHISEKITLSDLSNKYYVSRSTLSAAFHSISGVSFKDYLISYRLAEAKQMLATTDLSVEKISSKVGYINVNNFIRLFELKEHLTPLKYRQQIQQIHSTE